MEKATKHVESKPWRLVTGSLPPREAHRSLQETPDTIVSRNTGSDLLIVFYGKGDCP